MLFGVAACALLFLAVTASHGTLDVVLSLDSAVGTAVGATFCPFVTSRWTECPNLSVMLSLGAVWSGLLSLIARGVSLLHVIPITNTT